MATPYSDGIVPKLTVKSVGLAAAAISSVNQLVISFIVQNPSNATGLLFVGGSNIDATACIVLSAGDSFEAPQIPSGYETAEYDLAGWYVRSNVATIKAKILRIVKGRQLS